MTDQHEPEQGGVATMEPESANEAPESAVTQTPLDANENASPPARDGKPERRAARALKRAERAERRPERNGRNERTLGAVVTPPVEPAEPTPAPTDAAADAIADAAADEPLAQEAMPEPEPEAPAVPEFESAPTSDSLVAASDHAGEDAAAEPTAASRREGNPKRADRLERKAARRGDAQDGAEPAPSREERRADRAERRAARPVKATVAANGAGEPAAAPDGAVGSSEAESDAPKPPTLVRADVGAIPALDGKAKRADRKAGRMDVQHAAAAEALSVIDPNNAAIAPLIRYVNAVSMHLNESQKTIGKLQVERDALRAQVVSLDAEPIDASRMAEIAMPAGASDAADVKHQRRSERQAAKAEAGDASADDSEDDAAKPMDDTGRKRRLIALGVLAVVGVVALGTRVMNHPIDLSNMSKGSLGSLAVVGQFMQVFLAGMIFYRLARIGGRAGRWLFPENDPKMVKKHQQESKGRQKKGRQADA